MSKLYDQSNYLEYIPSLGIYESIDNKFVEEIKKVQYQSIVNVNGRLLDEIAHVELNNSDMWWMIGVYNDVVDPFKISQTKLYIPNGSQLEALSFKYLESKI